MARKAEVLFDDGWGLLSFLEREISDLGFILGYEGTIARLLRENDDPSLIARLVEKQTIEPLVLVPYGPVRRAVRRDFTRAGRERRFVDVSQDFFFRGDERLRHLGPPTGFEPAPKMIGSRDGLHTVLASGPGEQLGHVHASFDAQVKAIEAAIAWQTPLVRRHNIKVRAMIERGVPQARQQFGIPAYCDL